MKAVSTSFEGIDLLDSPRAIAGHLATTFEGRARHGADRSVYLALARILRATTLGDEAIRFMEQAARRVLRERREDLADDTTEAARKMVHFVDGILAVYPLRTSEDAGQVTAVLLHWIVFHADPWSEEIRARLGDVDVIRQWRELHMRGSSEFEPRSDAFKSWAHVPAPCGFADEDEPDPRDPYGYLAEDERYLYSGPLPDDAEPEESAGAAYAYKVRVAIESVANSTDARNFIHGRLKPEAVIRAALLALDYPEAKIKTFLARA